MRIARLSPASALRPISCRKLRIHTASFAALHNPMYSASVFKVDIAYYFRDA
jgi:hypothetical protein